MSGPSTWFFPFLAAGLVAGGLALSGCGEGPAPVVLEGCGDLSVGESIELTADYAPGADVTWMLRAYPGEEGNGTLMPKAGGAVAQFTATEEGKVIVEVFADMGPDSSHDECVLTLGPSALPSL